MSGSKGKKILKYLGIGFLILCGLSMISSLLIKQKIPSALPYTVISQEKINKSAGEGVEATISFTNLNLPNDLGKITTQNLGDTVMKAAMDLSQNGAKIIIVNILTDTKGKYSERLAQAIYTPDGKGISGTETRTWKVEASKQLPTTLQVQVREIWWQNRKQFQKDGSTDEPAIKSFIAKKLDIPVDQVTMGGATFPQEYFKN